MWICAYFQRIRDRLQRGRPQFVAAHVGDMPEKLETGRVYIVGTDPKPWAAAFVCPCGCAAAVRLNLLPEASPAWAISVNRDQTVSISPSVRRTVGCRSHFWIERGYVVYAFDFSRRRAQ